MRAAIAALLNNTNPEESRRQLDQLRDDIGNFSNILALSRDKMWILEQVNESLASGDILTRLREKNFTKSLKEIGRQALVDYLQR